MAMSPIVKISLILIATIVIGAIIRMTVFQRYIPEGFENEKKEEDAKTPEDGGEKEKEKEAKEGESKDSDAVKLDSDANMKNFLQENGDNKKLMGSINSDTHAMIQNQKELMDMMKTVQPALQQGMEFMKAFKGMMKQD